MELFNSVLEYKNGCKDKLAVFDGNVSIGAIENPNYGAVKTAIGFRRVVKPEDKSIGDYAREGAYDDIEGYAFHFQYPESVQVVIDTLMEIKRSMESAINQPQINKSQWRDEERG